MTEIDESFHKYRWRLLTLWIVAFTLLTAYALWAQRHDSRRTDHRFCAVTSAFLQSESDLRDQLNRADVIEIGLRQAVQEAARNGTYVFALVPTTVLDTRIRDAAINFFQAIDDLEQAQVRLGQVALSRTDAFVNRLDQLRRRLHC